MSLEKLFRCFADKKEHVKHVHLGGGRGGAFYFLGFIGALIYYWGTSTTFLEGVIGFFKALVWPAFLVFGLLSLVGA